MGAREANDGPLLKLPVLLANDGRKGPLSTSMCSMSPRVEAIATGGRPFLSGWRPFYEAISNKKLLGAPGIATRSKDATRARGSCPYY